MNIAVEQWDVESDSRKGKTYRVIGFQDGTYTCTCPDFAIKINKGQTSYACKHIIRVALKASTARLIWSIDRRDTQTPAPASATVQPAGQQRPAFRNDERDTRDIDLAL